jgi:ATP-dependent DNA helicase DinG
MLPAVLDGYHPRSTQIIAATMIDDTLRAYSNAVIEAPTGCGKTMAYLIPVYAQGKRTIIATKTKQLMNQLFMKDIPTVRQLFGDRSVATLKGRKNYFCPHRFHKWIYPNSIYYKDVIDWYESRTDDFSELPKGLFDVQILDKISADSNQCIYSKCAFSGSCPFNIAKDIANSANIVITNHHLLLTDIAMKAEESYGKIFDPTDHIIFDEAHSIPDIYAMYAGVELSVRRLTALIADYKDKIPFDDISELNARETSLRAAMNDTKVL